MSNTIKHKLDDLAGEDECVLIGIISSALDFTVCWHINKQLNINLSRTEDIKFEVINKSKKIFVPDLFTREEKTQTQEKIFSHHHVFKYLDDNLFSDYFFIVNKGTSLNLEPQLKKVNYFLEINGKNAENAEQLIFDLNAIEPIEMAYIIGKESIINKLHLPV
jgi:hypothetical protein